MTSSCAAAHGIAPRMPVRYFSTSARDFQTGSVREAIISLFFFMQRFVPRTRQRNRSARLCSLYFAPVLQADYRQREFECLFPIRRVRLTKALVNLFLWAGFATGGLLSAQTKQQSAFGRIVHVPVQDKRIDAVQHLDFLVSVTICRCLNRFTFRTCRRVEPLLAQNKMARLAQKEQVWLPQVSGEHFEILERDARRVFVRRRGLIVPESRLEEVFGIGMKRKVPVEVAVRPRAVREIVEKRAAGEGLPLIARAITNVPMVFE